jgi:hypothetical protein
MKKSDFHLCPFVVNENIINFRMMHMKIQNKRSLIMILAGVIFFPMLAFAQTSTDFDYNEAKLINKSGGTEEYIKPDGTRIFRSAEKEKAVLKDGSVIIKYKDGKREISTKDGTKLYIDFDGTRKYVYSDGKVKIVSLDGKTPYGEDISPVERRLKKSSAALDVEYSGMLSDDLLDGYIKKFFDELISSADIRMNKTKLPADYNNRLVVSHCKFCTTGYCRRKNKKEITVELFRGIEKLKEYNIEYTEIFKIENRQKYIEQILSEAIK